MIVNAQAIAQVLAAHPDITVDGFQYTTTWGSEGFEPVRWLLLSREFESDTQLAVDWIKSNGANASSSRIKQTIEKQSDRHISHGAVIAAALILGYQPVRDPHSPNCSFQTGEQP